MGIFVGACMVAGSLTAGFRQMLDVYLLDSLANKDHGYVFLFILFMAGLVGLIEKAGGEPRFSTRTILPFWCSAI